MLVKNSLLQIEKRDVNSCSSNLTYTQQSKDSLERNASGENGSEGVKRKIVLPHGRRWSQRIDLTSGTLVFSDPTQKSPLKFLFLR